MTLSAEPFLSAAEIAVGVLGAEELADGWSSASALPGFSVGGLACHLATQVIALPAWLSSSSSAVPMLTIDEHYGRAAWVDSGPESEANTVIRELGEQQSREIDAAGLLAETRAALATLWTFLPGLPGDRPVRNPRWQWALPLDEFLLTRMVEIVVHTDDLAVSVDRPTPDFPAGVVLPVVGVLTRVSLRRHGQRAVLRALSRAERAPGSIAAI